MLFCNILLGGSRGFLSTSGRLSELDLQYELTNFFVFYDSVYNLWLNI